MASLGNGLVVVNAPAKFDLDGAAVNEYAPRVFADVASFGAVVFVVVRELAKYQLLHVLKLPLLRDEATHSLYHA